MISPRHLVFFLALPLLALGCAAQTPMHAWVERQGGTVADARQARVDSVSRVLVDACHGREITIRVIANDQLCAFGWPSGHLFVSRGLVDHLNDQELAAAIAHELGHLLSDGQLQSVASLRGSCSNPDREVRADAAGIALLETAHLPPRAMMTMLQKVGAAPSSRDSRSALERRIQLISLQIAAPAAVPVH